MRRFNELCRPYLYLLIYTLLIGGRILLSAWGKVFRQFNLISLEVDGFSVLCPEYCGRLRRIRIIIVYGRSDWSRLLFFPGRYVFIESPMEPLLGGRIRSTSFYL